MKFGRNKKMHKVLIFDLDGTLAKIGKPIEASDISKLKQLYETGYQIAICSGKPVYYLCGMFRQTGLDQMIFIGENGAAIQYGVDLPPKKFAFYPYSTKAKKQLSDIKHKIAESCENIWFQPNDIGVTPFPCCKEDFETINRIIEENRDDLNEIEIYPQVDCFDFTPKNISKANGIAYFAEKEGFSRSDFIAIGDGINDIPMFEFADISISIGEKMKDKTDYCFKNISDALDFIITQKL